MASRYTETMTIDERLEKLTERHEALTQTVELMAAEGRETSQRISALERLAQQDGENIRALARIAEIARKIGLAADRAYGGRAPKKQFSAADRSGARWAVIIGADETQRGVVAVKDLRSDRPQCEVRREEIAAWLSMRKDDVLP